MAYIRGICSGMRKERDEGEGIHIPLHENEFYFKRNSRIMQGSIFIKIYHYCIFQS